jgi:cytochrome c oxidase cbb3-type subunit III
MKNIKNKIVAAISLAFVISPIWSQSETITNSVGSIFSSIATTDWILIFIAFFLLIPIFYMARIMSWSLKQYLEKMLNDKTRRNLSIALLFFLPIALSAQAMDTTTSAPASSTNFLRMFLLGLIVMEVVVLTIFGNIFYKQFNYFEKGPSPEQPDVKKESALARWWNKMNNFGPIEDEAKIDLGHNYDGIRELDNNIPAWFTGIFLATVLFGVIYMWRYHIAEISPLQIEEYKLEEEQAAIDHAQYLKTAGSTIDEATLAFSSEAADLENGKKLYLSNCANCHVADGGGAQGPNLTDKNWVYGCAPGDIYKSIKYGRPKGMMAWKDNFNDKQITELMNYVHFLQGSKPASPKPAQGDECKEVIAETTVDSASATAVSK